MNRRRMDRWLHPLRTAHAAGVAEGLKLARQDRTAIRFEDTALTVDNVAGVRVKVDNSPWHDSITPDTLTVHCKGRRLSIVATTERVT